MNLANYDDSPKKEGEEREAKKSKPYRGFRDQHDYGQSDNEEQW